MGNGGALKPSVISINFVDLVFLLEKKRNHKMQPVF